MVLLLISLLPLPRASLDAQCSHWPSGLHMEADGALRPVWVPSIAFRSLGAGDDPFWPPPRCSSLRNVRCPPLCAASVVVVAMWSGVGGLINDQAAEIANGLLGRSRVLEISFQPAIVVSRLDLMNYDITPSARVCERNFPPP